MAVLLGSVGSLSPASSHCWNVGPVIAAWGPGRRAPLRDARPSTVSSGSSCTSRGSPRRAAQRVAISTRRSFCGPATSAIPAGGSFAKVIWASTRAIAATATGWTSCSGTRPTPPDATPGLDRRPRGARPRRHDDRRRRSRREPRPSSVGPSTRSPLRIFGTDLAHAGEPVPERTTLELILQPIEEGVHAAREDNRGRAGEAAVAEAQKGRVADGSQLPPDDAPLPLRQVLAGFDIPFVLEHSRRFPREDFSGHVEPGRTAEVVDHPPAARVEARLSQVPLREMLRIRDRFPHGLDGMPERSLEGQRREVTLKGEPARARTDGYRHADLFL